MMHHPFFPFLHICIKVLMLRDFMPEGKKYEWEIARRWKEFNAACVLCEYMIQKYILRHTFMCASIEASEYNRIQNNTNRGIKMSDICGKVK